MTNTLKATVGAPVPTAKITFAGKLTDEQLLEKVRAMPWIKKAKIKKVRIGSGYNGIGQRKALIIQTHDFALDHGGRGMTKPKVGDRRMTPRDQRHLIKGLTFRISLEHNGRHPYLSEVLDTGRNWARYSHPHIGGGDICWGSGDGPLRDAIRREDFLSFVTILGIWLNKPNYGDSYSKTFPATDHPAGWIIPKKGEKKSISRWFKNLRKRA